MVGGRRPPFSTCRFVASFFAMYGERLKVAIGSIQACSFLFCCAWWLPKAAILRFLFYSFLFCCCMVGSQRQPFSKFSFVVFPWLLIVSGCGHVSNASFSIFVLCCVWRAPTPSLQYLRLMYSGQLMAVVHSLCFAFRRPFSVL